jgi:hypothetical protein
LDADALFAASDLAGPDFLSVAFLAVAGADTVVRLLAAAATTSSLRGALDDTNYLSSTGMRWSTHEQQSTTADIHCDT